MVMRENTVRLVVSRTNMSYDSFDLYFSFSAYNIIVTKKWGVHKEDRFGRPFLLVLDE